MLFLGADLNGNLQENIKANQLKTNGSYKFVRNPCYCMFLYMKDFIVQYRVWVCFAINICYTIKVVKISITKEKEE